MEERYCRFYITPGFCCSYQLLTSSICTHSQTCSFRLVFCALAHFGIVLRNISHHCILLDKLSHFKNFLYISPNVAFHFQFQITVFKRSVDKILGRPRAYFYLLMRALAFSQGIFCLWPIFFWPSTKALG